LDLSDDEVSVPDEMQRFSLDCPTQFLLVDLDWPERRTLQPSQGEPFGLENY
jgi:hypothetical protein